MSLTKQLDLAGGWLNDAYRKGFTDVAFVRGDADLANFRNGKPERYKALTTAKWSYRIDFGIFNDDVVVSNDSPFELTNIRVDLVVKKGGRTWQPDLTLPSLKPGTSYTFSNVFSIPGSSYDEAKATLNSDQGVN